MSLTNRSHFRAPARTSNRRAIASGCAAALASAGLLAASASASTVSLANGGPTGGLSLNAANVLVASATDFGSSTTYTVQNVTFSSATYDSGGTSTISASLSNNGVTVNYSVAGGFLANSFTVSNTPNSNKGFQYTTNSTTDSSLTSNGANTGNDTLAGTQPTGNSGSDAALASLLNANVVHSTGGGANDLTVKITGLSTGTSYAVDIVQSDSGFGWRSQSLTFNGGVATDNAYLYDNGSGNSSDYSFGYDTHEVLAAVGGQITVVLHNTGDAQGDAINAVVVSSVPEPASLGLLGAAALGLTMRRRRAR